jgi:hypothetical protein
MDWETARHNAWHARGSLDYILKESNPDKMTTEELATDLRTVAAKLIRAADIMEGHHDDTVGFIHEKHIVTNSTEGVTCTGDDCQKKEDL